MPGRAARSEGAAMENRVIAPVPRITVQAFCETAGLAEVIEAAAGDRRMQKAHVKIQMGGGPAAVEAYRHAPTPNVVVLESHGERNAVLGHLDSLAEVCDEGTKVIVIGHVNDVVLYRDLTRRGVSEYLIAPVAILDFVSAISDLFTTAGADKLMTPTVVVDLDIALGTAALAFNQDPPQSVAEAIFAPDRLDANLVDRLLSRCSDRLSLLAAPAVLDRTVDLSETAIDGLIDILRASVPAVVLDVPHAWSAWIRRTLIGVDQIVIVAAPELASLRNAKNLFETLRLSRPNDRAPNIVLNLTGVPKRPEIAASEFGKALGAPLSAIMPFDAQLFGMAANNGQMLAEVQPSAKAAEILLDLACAVTGRGEPKRSRMNLLEPILAKLARRKAS